MPTILSPQPPVFSTAKSLAPRLTTLAGARVSLLDNSKANAGPLLAKVLDGLVEHHGAKRGITERKSSSGIPATQGMLDRLRAASDFVLTASADCGSCTSGCVQDTVALEVLGVPTVLLGTDAFHPLAKQLAEWLNLPTIQAAITPHPLGGITESELDRKAVELTEVVAKLAVSAQD
ncbi:MAG TPA: hypothetical protein VHC18_11775 [Amycolatopsis sp.]|nr:hypothetical protein [Amycolatopsis sp.]